MNDTAPTPPLVLCWANPAHGPAITTFAGVGICQACRMYIGDSPEPPPPAEPEQEP
jgi:hypothetical protein